MARFRRDRENGRITPAVVTVCLVTAFALIVGSLALFIKVVRDNEYRQISWQLDEVADQQKSRVEDFLNGQIDVLTILSGSLSRMNDIFGKEAYAMLEAALGQASLSNYAVANLSGGFMTRYGEQSSCAGRDYFEKALAGEPNISGMITSSITGDIVYVIAVPVNAPYGVAGVLLGTYHRDTLSAAIDVTSFGGMGVSFIMNAEGRFVTIPPDLERYADGGLFSMLEDGGSFDGVDADALREALRGAAEHALLFRSAEGEAYYACSRPLSMNGWHVVSVTPESVADDGAQPISRAALLFTAFIVTMLTLAFLLIIRYVDRTRRSLLIGRERFRVATMLLAQTVFDYDPRADALTFGEGDEFRGMLGLPARIEHPRAWLGESRLLDTANQGRLNDMLTRLRAGERESACVVSCMVNQQMYWLNVTAANVDSVKAGYLVGTLTDVSRQKNEEQRLRYRAEYDPLTRLCNRDAFQTQITSALDSAMAQTDLHALLMVDVDNFKAINDAYGHICGDMLLEKVAYVMRSLFRQGDVLGRLGGDEFVVFMADIDSKAAAEQKAKKLVAYVASATIGAEISAKVSCSIGVAFAPGDASTFEDLYACADAALYRAKSQGKSRYVIYDDFQDGKAAKEMRQHEYLLREDD